MFSSGMNSGAGMASQDINHNLYIRKACFVYTIISVFCALFGAIYELYSHEVYSYFMLYAFAIPLVFGALPLHFLTLKPTRRLPNRAAFNAYNSSVATFTVGCMFKGVLEIYGTTNELINIYWIAGGVLLLISIILYLAKK